MTQQSIIYGFIQGAEGMKSDPHKLHRLNRAIIESLPEKDAFPHLSRSMFAIPGEDPASGTYKSQIIHFGGSMQDVEHHWKAWLDKFEALLRRLYWFNAVVQLRGEIVGDVQYEWTVDANQIVHYFAEPPKPATKFYFDGGPRVFDLG